MRRRPPRTPRASETWPRATRRLAALHLRNERTDAALEHLRELLPLHERLVELDPADAQARFDLAGAYNRRGEILLASGQPRAGLESFRAFLRLAEELAEADPGSALVRRRHGVALFKLGEAHRALAAEASDGARAPHWREARDWTARSLAVFEGMHADGVLQDAAAILGEVRGVLELCEAELEDSLR